MNRRYEEAIKKLEASSAMMREASAALVEVSHALVDSSKAMDAAHMLQSEAIKLVLDANEEHDDLREHVVRLEGMILDLIKRVNGGAS